MGMYNKGINITAVLCIIAILFPCKLLGEERSRRAILDRDRYYSSVNQYHSSPRSSYEDFLPRKRNSRENLRRDTGKSQKRTYSGRKDTRRGVTRKEIKIYRVRRGDTLYGISKKFGIKVKSLVNINGINHRNRIWTGMKLKIPVSPSGKTAGTAYKKKRGSKGTPGAPGFRWPLKRVITYRKDGKNGVRSIGIVIRGDKGSSVLSSAPGTVKKIGKMRGYGNYVVILHKNRYITIYSKLGSVKVHEGEKIGTGEVIGQIQSGSLHFQINHEKKSLNPVKLLRGKS